MTPFSKAEDIRQNHNQIQSQILMVFVVCVLAAVTGCAYRFGETDREIPGGYRTVSVPTFANKTQEAGIEVYFTNAIVREIERSRIGRVTSRSEAQTTLEGVVDSVQFAGGSPVEGTFLPSNTVLNTQYRIVVTTTLSLYRNSDRKLLWQGNFSNERSYLAPIIGIESLNSANATYNQSARYQNIQGMAADMMTEAHNRLTENF
ncbi:MAG: LptE family protein [Bdellovibrionota bacterium]